MQYFTIKDIENLSGIKAHTLRIWEQRYSFFVPKRKESLHRIYDNEDLKRLLRIAFLYHNGWKVSRIASLTDEFILEEVRKTSINEQTQQSFVLQMIEAAIDFDEARFVQVMEELIASIGFAKCITSVCYPFLQRIGLLWVTNNIIPAQEHFTSYIIQNKIIAETERLPKSNTKPEVILFSPKGEYHELPLLFLNYLLRKNKWGTIYLGVNITKDVLLQFNSHDEIQYLVLHHLTNFTGWDADVYFEDICRQFHDKKIVAIGTVVHQVQRNFVNLELLKTEKEIYAFINRKENEQV